MAPRRGSAAAWRGPVRQKSGRQTPRNRAIRPRMRVRWCCVGFRAGAGFVRHCFACACCRRRRCLHSRPARCKTLLEKTSLLERGRRTSNCKQPERRRIRFVTLRRVASNSLCRYSWCVCWRWGVFVPGQRVPSDRLAAKKSQPAAGGKKNRKPPETPFYTIGGRTRARLGRFRAGPRRLQEGFFDDFFFGDLPWGEN